MHQYFFTCMITREGYRWCFSGYWLYLIKCVVMLLELIKWCLILVILLCVLILVIHLLCLILLCVILCVLILCILILLWIKLIRIISRL